MYVIIKEIKNKKTGNILPVIILDSQCEVLEFEIEAEAEFMKEIFQKNSDSGYKYLVKKM